MLKSLTLNHNLSRFLKTFACAYNVTGDWWRTGDITLDTEILLKKSNPFLEYLFKSDGSKISTQKPWIDKPSPNPKSHSYLSPKKSNPNQIQITYKYFVQHFLNIAFQSLFFKACPYRLKSSLTFYCGHYASNIEPTHEQSVSAVWYLEARPLLPPAWRQDQGWRRSQLATDGHWPLQTPAQCVLSLPDMETVAADVSDEFSRLWQTGCAASILHYTHGDCYYHWMAIMWWINRSFEWFIVAILVLRCDYLIPYRYTDWGKSL